MGHVFRTCKDHKERLTPQPFVTEPLRWEEHHRRLKELDKRLDELNLNVYSLPEDREDPLRDIWHKKEEKDRLEMCVDGPPWEGTVQIPPDQGPVRLKFGTMHRKHLFLKYAEVLRQAGFKVDDS
ncbi:hypothetical protein ABBQ32_000848 [Trebouxia sp. C0010 RCD-2024]